MRKLVYLPILLIFLGCSKKREFPIKLTLDSYQHTNFSYTITQAMEEDKNQIYCPTILYAWDYLKIETKTSLSHGRELSQDIDRSEYHVNSLTEGAYNSNIQIEGNYIKVNTEFSLSLPFLKEFTRNNHDLRFKDKYKVESFGCSDCLPKTRNQIDVMHYGGQNDFAIRIAPKDTTNEILLYRTDTPRKSLHQHYKDLRRKMSNVRNEKDWWRYKFLANDIFEAPILEFNIEDDIEELIGTILTNKTDSITIDEAKQRIALIFDEKGAEIESEAKILSKSTDAEVNKPIPKLFIFDNSFLLVFKKRKSENPYLVLWIENNELMKKKTY